jgi:rhodanese-related sulfurtransferase
LERISRLPTHLPFLFFIIAPTFNHAPTPHHCHPPPPHAILSYMTIEPTITMQDLTTRFPGAQRALFRAYHIGGCASCGFQPGETLEQVCARNGNLPVNEVIAKLQQAKESDERMQIAPADADALVKAGKAKLLDVRSQEEWDAVHIEGSTFFTQELMREIGGWPKEQELIFVCHHGVRSLDAVAYFAGHGLENVRSLRGGIDAWSQDVDPLVQRYELA